MIFYAGRLPHERAVALRLGRVELLLYWTKHIGISLHVTARANWYMRLRLIPVGLNLYWWPPTDLRRPTDAD